MRYLGKKARGILLFILSAIFLLSCSPSGERVEVVKNVSTKKVIRVALSDEAADIAKELLDDYAMDSGISYDLTDTHSPEAKNHVTHGSADIAIVTVRMAPSGDEDFIYVPFAFNGLIFLADKWAGVTNLTKRQVEDIFSGKVKNWKGVGGNDLPITVITRPKHSSSRKAMENFIRGRPIMLGKDVDTFYAETSMAALSATRTIEGFLAYINASGTNSGFYGGVPLAIDGIEPLITNIPHKPYPIPLEMSFITNSGYGSDIRDLIDYTLSSRGGHKIAAQGLVPAAENMKISACHCRSKDGTIVPTRGVKKGTLTIGIVPELGVTTQEKRYRELAKYLADQLRFIVRLKHFESYERVVEEFRNGRIEAAFVGSYVYGLLREDLSVSPVARPVTRSKSEYRGLLCVLKGSGVKSLAGLKGKRVSYVPLTTAGELFMKELVRSEGFKVNTFFGNSLPTLSHEDSFNVLVDGKVDGAFVKDLVLERIFRNHPEMRDKVLVLAESQSVPDNALVVTSEIYGMIGGELQVTLESIHETKEGKRALVDMGAEKFIATSHEDYFNLYMMAEEAGEKI